jgi:hypothetical protein
MKPDENQNPTTEPRPNIVTEGQESTTPSTSQPTANNTTPTPVSTPTQPNKSHKKTIIISVVVLVLVLVAGGAFALYRHNHKAKPVAALSTTKTSNTTKATTKTSTTPVATNTWTGKDNNYNWNDANNWSLGIPTNNQILEINVADVTQPTDQYGTTSFAFQDNIPNLTINKLVIDGTVASFIFDIKGDPLTITNGIEDTTVRTDSSAGVPQVQIDNQINFTGNSTIETTGNNILTFVSANSGEVINLGSSTLQFTASGSSQIDVSGAIAGTGEILLPNNAVSSTGLVMFDDSSPNFNGKVVVGSGDTAVVGNQDNGGYGTVDAFGNSSVDIMNGGSMELTAAGTSSFTVNNPISVSGNGVTQSNGSVTGAISACVTSAEEGCGASESITFTGQVKLLGNTQIGQSTPSSLGASNTHVSYTLNNLDKNGYALTTVTDYYYSAEF